MLSVIIPVFNEKSTIEEIIRKVQAVPLDKEIILVDDCSTDGTREIISKIHVDNIKVILHSTNNGKGQSIVDALKLAVGEYAVIQDADLEYDPQEYTLLIQPLTRGEADIVYGARFFYKRLGLPTHKLGNQALTGLVNFLFRSNLNDYLTCYKMARTATFRNLNLSSRGFEIETEITCRALNSGLRIAQVPISYYPRNFKEGKKIRFKDGILAVLYILKYRFAKKEKA